MDDEPRRWVDDPDIDPELRDDLARAAEVSPSIDVGAGLSRLNDAMRGGGGGGAAGGAGGAGGWIAGAIIAAAIGGGALTWALLDRPVRHERPRDPPALEASEPDPAGVSEASLVEPPLVEPSRVEPRAEDVEVQALAPHAVEPRDAPLEARATADDDEPREAARARRRSASPTEGDPLREEMELLGRARAALASDPARALALAEESRRRFPEGLFGEEREAIAILASSALGRAEQARRRGERFLRAHPSGPFSERVRRAIDAP